MIEKMLSFQSHKIWLKRGTITYRYASYRNYIWWIHGRLGRGNRRVIPSCAVSRIRAEFEEEDGNYSTFMGNDEEENENYHL